MSRGKKLIENEVARLERLIEGREADIANYKKRDKSDKNKNLKVPVNYSSAIENSKIDIARAKKSIKEYEADLKKLK